MAYFVDQFHNDLFVHADSKEIRSGNIDYIRYLNADCDDDRRAMARSFMHVRRVWRDPWMRAGGESILAQKEDAGDTGICILVADFPGSQSRSDLFPISHYA